MMCLSRCCWASLVVCLLMGVSNHHVLALSTVAKSAQRRTSKRTPLQRVVASPLPPPVAFDTKKQKLETTNQINTNTLPLWKMALAGSLATILSDATMHPLDCIKTLQQSDQGLGLSITACVGYLWQTYGIGGFYHGLGTYATSDAIGGALKFSTYESMKDFANKRAPSLPQEYVGFLCAAVAFLVSSAVIVPGELLKQQLQMGLYPNVLDAITNTFATLGVKGFFVGYDGVCVRDVPYTMLELGLYDLLKNVQQQTTQHQDNHEQSNVSSWQQEIIAAAVTGGVAALLTTPFDTIKTKVMVNSYANFGDCLVSTIHDHGVLSVFAGADARVAWLVPFTAIYLPCYDYVKRQMIQQEKQQR